MMLKATLYGLSSFLLCWLAHVVIWHIHRPRAYPIWLMSVFYGAPFLIGVVLLCGSFLRMDGALKTEMIFLLGTATLLHCLLAACYIFQYAGIIEYSPSDEIVMEVSRSMPEGLLVNELSLDSLSEYQLTGKRIEHLLKAGMLVQDGQNLRTTSKGKRVIRSMRLFRRMLSLDAYGKG